MGEWCDPPLCKSCNYYCTEFLIKTVAVLNVTVDELTAGIFEAMQEN